DMAIQNHTSSLLAIHLELHDRTYSLIERQILQKMEEMVLSLQNPKHSLITLSQRKDLDIIEKMFGLIHKFDQRQEFHFKNSPEFVALRDQYISLVQAKLT